MQKTIDALSDHIIVCGVGKTGLHVVQEFLAAERDFVAIDSDESHIVRVHQSTNGGRFPYLVGDATDDQTLALAGVERARALVAALRDDKDNLYVIVTARQANPRLRIVSRSIGSRAPDKLRKAGADAVVSTNYLGGMRLAGEVLRPHVTEFLEETLRERNMELRIEEVSIPAGSPIAGKTIRDADIRGQTDALVLAMRDQATGSYQYNPGPNALLPAGTTLIVLVPMASLKKLRAGMRSGFGESA